MLNTLNTLITSSLWSPDQEYYPLKEKVNSTFSYKKYSSLNLIKPEQKWHTFSKESFFNGITKKRDSFENVCHFCSGFIKFKLEYFL